MWGHMAGMGNVGDWSLSRCAHVHSRMRTYPATQTPTHAHAHTYAPTHVRTCTHAHMHTLTGKCARTHRFAHTVCVHTDTHAHTHAHTHTHKTHTHTHTLTHTHTHTHTHKTINACKCLRAVHLIHKHTHTQLRANAYALLITNLVRLGHLGRLHHRLIGVDGIPLPVSGTGRGVNWSVASLSSAPVRAVC